MAEDQAKQFLDQAVNSLRNQQFETAIDFARQAVDLDPQSADAYGVLGIALSRANRPDEATEALQKAIQATPSSAKAYYNLAAHFYAIGEKRDALSIAQEAVRCDPSHKAASDLANRIEQETRTEAAPYMTSAGEEGRSPYDYGTPTGERPQAPQQPASPYVRPPQATHYHPAQYLRPKHALRWIENMGAGWPIIAWTLLVIQAVTFFYLKVWEADNTAQLERLSEQSDSLEAQKQIIDMFMREVMVPGLIYISVWFLWLAVWIIDLIDLRPSAGLLTLSIVAMVISLPCCYGIYTPVVSIVMFIIYMLVSRKA